MASRASRLVPKARVCTLLVLTFLFGVTGLSAQPFVSRQYAIEEGLAQSQAYAIHQDPAGFLWIGTLGGLSRFDGLQFTNFSIEDGLAGNAIRALADDDQGRLWVATDDGISIFDGRSFINLSIADGLPDQDVTELLADRDGRLWIGTRSGLALFAGDSLRLVDLGLPEATPLVTSLAAGPDGSLWVGTSRGLCRLEQVGAPCIDKTEGLPHRYVISLLVDSRSRTVVGTPRGVAVLDGDAVRVYDDSAPLPSPIVSTLMEDNEGSIWVGTRTGLSRIDSAGNMHIFRRDKSWIVSALYQDREGNVWVGTSGQGIFQYRRTAFFHKNPDYGMASDIFLATFEDSRGHMWIGTLSQGVYEIEGDTVKQYTVATGLLDDHVRSVAEDAAGAIWIGTSQGLSILKDGRFTNFTTDEGLNNRYVFALHARPDGSMWIGTRSGLNVYSHGRLSELALVGLPDNTSVYSFREGSDNTLYIGTSAGLMGYRDEAIHRIDALSNHAITAITESSEGVLWIGTAGYGLLRYSPDQGIVDDTLHTRHGLNSGTVYSAMFDRQGDLWIGTSRGINRLDGELLAMEGVKSIRSYGMEDGIVGVETNMNAAVLDRLDRLWVGTIEGLMLYDRSAEPKNAVPPPIYIGDIRLFLEPIRSPAERNASLVTLPEGLDLSYDQHHLTFDYYGLSFTHPEQVRYQYRMEGLDEDWSPETDNRFATYSHVPPGTYTFQVRARNRDGVWSTSPATYAFRMSAPFWETPWFMALSMAVVLLGIVGVIQLRTHTLNQRRKKLEAMVTSRTAELERTHQELLAAREHALSAAQAKTNFMAAITHELRTPMNGIMGMTELLTMTEMDEEQLDYTGTITDCSKNLMEIIENLLTFSDLAGNQREVCIQTFDLSDLLIDAVDLIRNEAAKKQLDVQCHVAPDVPGAFEADRSHLLQILNQLLSNAVKFTERGLVRIDVRRVSPPEGARSDTWLQLTVQDTGIGMDETQIAQAFEVFSQVDMSSTRRFGGTGIGLALARELTALVGGNLQASSVPGEGSTFYVTVPVDVPRNIPVA